MPRLESAFYSLEKYDKLCPYKPPMHLRKLELQGFKTFAQKTVLEFLPDSGNRPGLTAVVGPNGSGKSNIADAIRWVMGEQSLKLLRAKKSGDIIFTGSAKKSRAGFAEVSMTLINDDNQDIDLPEVVITRRLYRNGQSEYEINKKSVRLTDIVMLLAQAGIGQRTYSVIGQGMVDSILSASPTERKEFFDEAAGLRPFQLKRQSSTNKLQSTKDNLKQAELVLREIGPRLHTLERQAKRLQQRDEIEKELKELEANYYGGVWGDLRGKMQAAEKLVKAAEKESSVFKEEIKKLEGELQSLEEATPPSKGFRELRQQLDELARERSSLRERQMKLENSKELARVKSEKPWSPLPLSKIIEMVQALRNKYDSLWENVSSDKPEIDKLKKSIEELRESNEAFLSQLQRPAPEEDAEKEIDPALEKDLNKLSEQLSEIDTRRKETEERLDEWNKNEEVKRAHIFELQHKLTDVRKDASRTESEANHAEVELARIETRRDGFLQDLRINALALEDNLDSLANEFSEKKLEADPESLAPRLTKLRSQLEWIGGIDPETLKEYEETKQRFEELAVQTEDLKQAMTSLETVIAELDKTIKDRAETSFQLLDREFNNYFKKLFGGGEAKLLEIAPELEVDEDGNEIEQDLDGRAVGIDILATPPGKRLKSVTLLSGGERALISIALICAIMATNPSPFVVLDEVDAALDESNSRKFADIVDGLADRTQFVVVTHNRATMNQAHVLYGVTMGDEGVSKLLSVKLEEVS